MKLINLALDELVVSAELARSRGSKVFEERLKASIEEMGLAEPLKVAPLPSGKYLVVDGMIRLRAIQAIREKEKSAFDTIPAYVFDLGRRYELRFQSDIYQDLLPSQLATLVEHLHEAEGVRKVDIARYIGVSPATLRNYTGLWRLIQRRGLFARIVELMDVGIIPASNPYAWLRLTKEGLRYVLENSFSDWQSAEHWIAERIARARRGDVAPYSLKFVEAVTNALPSEYYREAQEVRDLKRELGLRRAAAVRKPEPTSFDARKAIRNLTRVSEKSPDRVLRVAARSLAAYLQ
ncbi:MAG TPA: ParB N-terminal domain-containing protein [Acidimicrobiales bacterium]|nr:ParB N-terminal domain-containing protein [Acidimicrobiales bacterium]